jgi:hypothetical protein
MVGGRPHFRGSATRKNDIVRLEALTICQATGVQPPGDLPSTAERTNGQRATKKQSREEEAEATEEQADCRGIDVFDPAVKSHVIHRQDEVASSGNGSLERLARSGCVYVSPAIASAPTLIRMRKKRQETTGSRKELPCPIETARPYRVR